MLHGIQGQAFAYFAAETNLANGLVADRSRAGAPCSIAATGLALTSYPVAVERGCMTRGEAARRTLATLRFFLGSRQEREPDATGYKGFYYHFLDMNTGARAWNSELSTVILYILALGAPTHAIPAECYAEWASTYQWRTIYDVAYLHAGSLFIHQLSHIWCDFRGIRDPFMRAHDCDYFENSRRATMVQQQYAIRNPHGYRGYDAMCWGITASSGPGTVTRSVAGMRRKFFGYRARGVPDGPDDGTLAPWGVATSLPFAPDIVLPSMEYMWRLRLGGALPYAVQETFNATFPVRGSEHGWVSPDVCGLEQGPMMVMIENHRSGLVWQLLRESAPIARGLRAAGFVGGWLDR